MGFSSTVPEYRAYVPEYRTYGYAELTVSAQRCALHGCYSALEVSLNDMHYINSRFTYLLTYLLTYKYFKCFYAYQYSDVPE